MASSMSVVVLWLMSSEYVGRGALVKSALELAVGEPDMLAAIEVWAKFIFNCSFHRERLLSKVVGRDA